MNIRCTYSIIHLDQYLQAEAARDRNCLCRRSADTHTVYSGKACFYW